MRAQLSLWLLNGKSANFLHLPNFDSNCMEAMYVCLFCIHVYVYVFMHVCMYVSKYICKCMYVCMYGMYVCMYVCMQVYVCMCYAKSKM